MEPKPKEQRFIITLKRPTIIVHGKEYKRAQIARDTGLSLSFISKTFSGGRSPSLRTATKLAAYFHISIEELMAFVIPSSIRKSDAQIDKMREEIVSGKRSLKQTYQGLVTGAAVKETLTIERPSS